MSTDDTNDHQYGCGGDMISSKKECTSCEQIEVVNNITKDIDSIAIQDDVSTCANCGKDGSSCDMNICNKCKSVKYCNAVCKKKHRSKHKKKCERRVDELHEEALFKEVEPDECPICMLPMPISAEDVTFKSCCGKNICKGCDYAMAISEGKNICAFCRTPLPISHDEHVERLKILMEKDVGGAFFSLSGYYARGCRGFAQDDSKSNELLLRGGQLGYSEAYYNLGCSYRNGNGVELDDKKAKHFFELSAMSGSIKARYALSCVEGGAGHYRRGMRHMMIAARAGHEKSLEGVKKGYTVGIVTKTEYADTLHAHKKIQDEMKSNERNDAELAQMIGKTFGVSWSAEM